MKKIITIFILIHFTIPLFSQTNPNPYDLSLGDYIFNEWDSTSAAGTYPNNMIFWTHSNTDPDLTELFTSNWECVYNLSNRSRFEGVNNLGISMVNTGNPQFESVCFDDANLSPTQTITDGRAGAIVLSLNTTNRENIQIEWTARTIAVNNRIYSLRMQYRIGDGNGDANLAWVDFLPLAEYTSQSNDGDFMVMPTATLPAIANNQSLVQIRWVYYYVSGSSSRAQIALDDVRVTSDAAGGTNPNPNYPTLYINELMATNSNTISDENGEFEDWFEIYNPSDSAIDIAGYFVTDDLSNTTMFQLPIGDTATIIPAKGFLLLWASRAMDRGPLHVDFKLSGSEGEAVGLVAPDGSTFIDSISFGPQDTDISYGRETDGNANWILFNSPTPGFSNNITSNKNNFETKTLLAYPNPIKDNYLNFEKESNFIIFDVSGRELGRYEKVKRINFSEYQKGLYLIRNEEGQNVKIIKN